MINWWSVTRCPETHLPDPSRGSPTPIRGLQCWGSRGVCLLSGPQHLPGACISWATVPSWARMVLSGTRGFLGMFLNDCTRHISRSLTHVLGDPSWVVSSLFHVAGIKPFARRLTWVPWEWLLDSYVTLASWSWLETGIQRALHLGRAGTCNLASFPTVHSLLANEEVGFQGIHFYDSCFSEVAGEKNKKNLGDMMSQRHKTLGRKENNEKRHLMTMPLVPLGSCLF